MGGVRGAPWTRFIPVLAVATLVSALLPATAAAAPEAYVVVCAATAADQPVDGSFAFTLDEVVPTLPLTPTRTVDVPVGGCTPPPGVRVAPGQDVRVTELPRQDETSVVEILPAEVSSSTFTRTAVVNAAAGTTTVTFVNRVGMIVAPEPKYGQVKVCKVAGPGVALARTFSFTVYGRPFSHPFGGPYPSPFSVGPFGLAAGWPQGTCRLLDQSFAVHGHVYIKEHLPGDVAVSSITVEPEARLISADLPDGFAIVNVGRGITEVTYTNRTRGQWWWGHLETCVVPRPPPDELTNPRRPGGGGGGGGIDDVVDADDWEVVSIHDRNGMRGRIVVPVGGCSEVVEVAPGPVTIALARRSSTRLVACRTVPRSRQRRCARAKSRSTVRVVRGDAATQSVAILTVR